MYTIPIRDSEEPNIFAMESKRYFEQSDMMITVVKKEFKHKFPSKYVLGMLNSKLFYVWLKYRGKLKGKALELYGRPLEEIPVKVPTEEIRDSIINSVTKILDSNNNDDVQENMNIIDRSLYQLYNLTEGEISIVESEFNNGF